MRRKRCKDGVDQSLGGQTNIDIKAFEDGTNPADDLAGPQLFAEQYERAILKIADPAEKIVWIGFVVSVHTALGEIAFESGITRFDQLAGTRAERFFLEPVDQGFQFWKLGSGNHDAALRRFAEGDLVITAILAEAVEMAEEIEGPLVFAGCGPQHAAPDARGVIAADWLAVLIVFD